MKKLLIILTIIINILLISLIPLNVYVLNIYMPEIISTILSEILIILNIALLIKTQKIYKSVIILCIPSIIFGFIGTYCNPYWNSVTYKNVSLYTKSYDKVLTKKEAKEDLEYAMKYLKKLHPALLKNTPEEIEQQYKIVKNNIETKDVITVNYLSKEIESIFSKLGDAHTEVIGNYKDYHVLKEMNKHNKNKEIITKINDIEIKDLFEQNKQYYSFETETPLPNQFENDLILLEGLDKFGINTEEIKYTFEQNNKEKEYTYKKEDFITQEEYNIYNNIEPQPQKSFVTYEIDEENNLAILYLDKCKNNDEYKRVLKEMFEKIKEKNIGNIAVDLRNNGGGIVDEAVDIADMFLDKGKTIFTSVNNKDKKTETLSKHDSIFTMPVIVLVNENSASASEILASALQDNERAKLVGTKTYGKGIIQTLLSLKDGSGLKITTEQYFTPKGTTIHKTGIKPDEEVKLPDTVKSVYRLEENEDTQLQKAIEMLK